MAAVNWLKYVYLARFSKPRSERQLYRFLKVRRVSRIVEVGISSVDRTLAVIGVAQRYAADGKVTYTGLDWFEGRAKELPKVTLKQTYTQLQATGAQIRLVPGEPGRSISAVANSHQHTGLLLISSAVSDSSLDTSWFYVPRMLDAETLVVRERPGEDGEPVFAMLEHDRIVEWAGGRTTRKAA